MDILFFGLLSLLSAIGMLSVGRSSYSALFFAVTTVSVCGLLVQLSASFLAAATVIIYAGAVIVTFIFLLMLDIDGEHKGTPVKLFLLPSVMSICVAIGFLYVIQQWTGTLEIGGSSQDESFSTVRSIGIAIYGRFLYSIEVAGTLLLVATIGAIAIAPKRSGGEI